MRDRFFSTERVGVSEGDFLPLILLRAESPTNVSKFFHYILSGSI